MCDFQYCSGRYAAMSRRRRRAMAVVILCWIMAVELGSGMAVAADVTFNTSLVGESDPLPGSPFYAEVWAEGDYAYVGSSEPGGGVSIFDISNPKAPQFLTMYAGTEMEDVEVYHGIGYFSSEGTNTGTGVDIVDLSNPADPVFLNRIDAADGGHQAVHTLSVSDGFLYTADNRTDVIKIIDVTTPSSPRLVTSLDIGAPANVASHQTTVLDGRLYVSSKWNGSNACCGWTHIYDVSNVDTIGPVLLKAFESGPRTHSSWPTEDGNTLVVCQERPDADVRIYDISMIDEPNDADAPVLLKTLNRTNLGIDAHSPHNPLIRGNLLFISWYEAGLQVFNIADPANPVHIGAFDTYPGTSTGYNGAWGVYPFLGLDKVLVGDRQRGLVIVDATDVLTPGDYNQDGRVDAADYVLWRTSDGTPEGYDTWRANFGKIVAAGGAPALSTSTTGEPPVATAAAPEPSSFALVAYAVAMAFGCRSLPRYSSPYAPTGGISMPVRRVTLSVGRKRGSTRKLTPKLSFDSSTVPPSVARSDSPMRVKEIEWPMLPLLPKSTAALAEPIHLGLMR